MKPESNVGSLHPSNYNPRKISKHDLKRLGDSMRKFGDLGGVVRNLESDALVGGHQRIRHFDPSWPIHIEERLKTPDNVGTVARGYIETPFGKWTYREVRWDETTERAANIAANAQGGEFDLSALEPLVQSLQSSGLDLDILGLKDVDSLLVPKSRNVDETVVPLPGKPRAKLGDRWILGDHVLMCGDSENPKDVERLMGDDLAAMVYMDPPYRVSYESKSGQFAIIKGDDKRADALVGMLTRAFKNAVAFASKDAGFYIWHASSTAEEFKRAMRAVGLVENQTIIWAKPGITPGHSDYRWAHEPMFYCSREGKRPKFYGGRDKPTIWRVSLRGKDDAATVIGSGVVLRDGHGDQILVAIKSAKGKKYRQVVLGDGETVHLYTENSDQTIWEVGKDNDYIHPNQKPVELSRRAIVNSSKPGEIVLDLFSGSGSTLMGAEITGRRARVMEIDPAYVDAATRRWETYTGLKAKLQDK